MSTPPPAGVYVPAVLFFDANEELDIDAISKHILRLAKGGVTGILVQGSNGEAQHLSHEERSLAIRTTRSVLDENGFTHVLIIAGTGAQSTRETIQLCVEAKEAGASHALVLSPSTWPGAMSADNIIRFHRAVGDASPIPTMVYNFPTVTAGLDLDSDTILAIASHPNVVGTKLSCGNIGKLHRITSNTKPEEFAVFAGKSEVFLQGLLSGSAGTIAALPNLLPKLHMKLYRFWKTGSTDEAMALQALLGQADWAVSKIGGVGGIKALIAENFGYGSPNVRAPLKAVAVEALRAAAEGSLVAGYYSTISSFIQMEKTL